MPSKLFIDSNKIINESYKLDRAIEGKWQLLSFCFTNNIFNVNSNNNKIYFNENGVNLVATLTNGSNDSTELKDNIETSLNNQSVGTFSIALDSKTNKYTITNTLNFHFTFGTNTTNSARKLLGFDETDGSDSTTQVSDTSLDLNTYKDIFLQVSDNNDRDIFGNNHFSTSFAINGTGAFGECIRYVNNDNFNQYVKLKKTKQIKIKVHDLNNNDIDLNSEYTLILQKI